MTRYYDQLVPTFSDRADWALPTVLAHHVAHRPDAIFLDAVEEDARWTYAEIQAAAGNVANGLFAAGAVPGDRVVIMGRNSSQFVRAWLGTAVGRLVEVPINTAYEHDFLAHQVVTAEAAWAIIDDEHADKWVAIADRCPVRHFWVVDHGQQSAAIDRLREVGLTAVPWEDLEHERDGALPEVRPHDLASIFYTSGTTGPSKGVAMPHAQMYFFGEETRGLSRFTARDTYLTTTPLFHGNAQFMAAYPALIAGGRLVIRSRFSASRWIDHVRESGATVTNLIGVMMDFVYKQPPRPDDRDNALRAIFAAPTAASIADDFRERFGLEAFTEVFGLTETSAPILSPYGEPRPPGAAGLQMAEWFDIRLVDPETDEEVPVGEVGELIIRPRVPWTCSLGYYGMPDRTAEAWRNLWFHTGDALRRDEVGWYYFVDRYKDALRRRGENISSFEIERGISSSPLVLDCAVIGVSASIEAGEDEVLACIVCGGRSPDPEAIWAHCDERLPRFAVPRFLRFMDHLPKTPSERVQKARLRADGVTAETFDREAATLSARG